MCLRIWRNTLSVQIKDIICMMQADHPFKVNGWSVSFLELAFYFGCPGVNAFGGFVTFVHFVEGKSYECTVYHGDGRGEGIPVRAATNFMERSALFSTFTPSYQSSCSSPSPQVEVPRTSTSYSLILSAVILSTLCTSVEETPNFSAIWLANSSQVPVLEP